MVGQAAEIGLEKAEYERERREAQGPGVMSSMIRQGVENRNIKNNIGKTGKRDLIGQAGCAKNDGGNCSSCNLRYGCSRYWV